MPRRPRIHGAKPRATKKHRAYDASRGSAASRGYDRMWQRLRLMKLNRNPLCEECQRQGLVVAAEEVDHIKAIAAGGDQWDFNNLQSLCKPCHSRKTVAEDGGLGSRGG